MSTLSALHPLNKLLITADNNSKVEPISNRGALLEVLEKRKGLSEVKNLSQEIKKPTFYPVISARKPEREIANKDNTRLVSININKIASFVFASVGTCILGLMGFHAFFTADGGLFSLLVPPPHSLHRRYFNTFTSGCDSLGFKLQKHFYDYMMPLFPNHSAVEFTGDRNMEGLKCVLEPIKDRFKVSRIATDLFQKVIRSLNKIHSFKFIKYFEELGGDITSNFIIPYTTQNSQKQKVGYRTISPLQEAYEQYDVEVFNYLLNKTIVQKKVDSHALRFCTKIFLKALEQLQAKDSNLGVDGQTKYYNFAKGAFLCLGHADAGYIFHTDEVTKEKIESLLSIMIEKRLHNLENLDTNEIDKNFKCDKALFKYAYDGVSLNKFLKTPHWSFWKKIWDEELSNCY